MSLSAQLVNDDPLGEFRIYARAPGADWIDITMFRGAPIRISSTSSSDPFSDTTAQLELPQVTVFDTPGFGDLTWLVPDADIDIRWHNYAHYDFKWSWEGFVASYDFGLDESGAKFSVDLKGALYALDDFLAKPVYPKRPVAYEVLIRNAFDQTRHPARLGQLRITFPQDWDKVMKKEGPGYLRPTGVPNGAKWTGMASRNTGSWNPLLTGHVQSLLAVMYDRSGSQWTIRNNGNRRPELFLRRIPEVSSPEILEVTLGAPGVSFSASRDFTQRANIIYGNGKDEAGITYNNMVIPPNGQGTRYDPFAYSPEVYPREQNRNIDRNMRPKERLINFQDGLDQVSALEVAQSQLQRFIEPGIIGSLTLKTDPRKADGSPFPRMLIQAGTTFRIKGLFGLKEGMLVHANQVTVDFNELTVTMSIDSKYRDQLTVEEVKARTRDAMDPVRMLQVGQYANTRNDLLMPWSYRAGSGIIPSGGPLSATEFFMEKLPADARFPYEQYTRKYPPSKYPNYYIKIAKANHNDSSLNWCGTRKGKFLKRYGVPVRMSQSGTIRLSQIAAYDKNGNVMKVKFHVSLYRTNGISGKAMPEFFEDRDTGKFPRYRKPQDQAGNVVPTSYQEGQEHPFIEGGFEEVNPDGTAYSDASQIVKGNSNIQIGWGNYFEPAGYSPGRFSRGATRTGLLEDATPWQFTLSDGLSTQGGQPSDEDAGHLFALIYCDEQINEPVYFMGRLFLQEQGA